MTSHEPLITVMPTELYQVASGSFHNDIEHSHAIEPAIRGEGTFAMGLQVELSDQPLDFSAR